MNSHQARPVAGRTEVVTMKEESKEESSRKRILASFLFLCVSVSLWLKLKSAALSLEFGNMGQGLNQVRKLVSEKVKKLGLVFFITKRHNAETRNCIFPKFRVSVVFFCIGVNLSAQTYRSVRAGVSLWLNKIFPIQKQVFVSLFFL